MENSQQYQKKYYDANKERLKKLAKEKYQQKRAHILEQKKKEYNENPDKYKRRSKQYRDTNLPTVVARNKEYRSQNKEKVANYSREWRSVNRLLLEQWNREWYQANSGKRLEYSRKHKHRCNAESARRRLQTLQAVPGWANPTAILQIYKEAKVLSEQREHTYDVDHVVPITSDLVCGLHTESNLQILLSGENRSKGNRWWPDMP